MIPLTDVNQHPNQSTQKHLNQSTSFLHNLFNLTSIFTQSTPKFTSYLCHDKFLYWDDIFHFLCRFGGEQIIIINICSKRETRAFFHTTSKKGLFLLFSNFFFSIDDSSLLKFLILCGTVILLCFTNLVLSFTLCNKLVGLNYYPILAK